MQLGALTYVLYGAGALFLIIVIAYLILNKKMQKSDYQQIKKLKQGNETSKFSSEAMYQKLYITYEKVPFLRRYILKLRRRLEIINVDDEYATRRDSAKILSKTLLILIPIVVLSIILATSDFLLLSILLFQLLLGI